MTHKTKPRVTRSSGNVFRDLGFPPDEGGDLAGEIGWRIGGSKRTRIVRNIKDTEGGSRRSPQSIVKEVIQSGQSVISADARADARFVESESVIAENIMSILYSVPTPIFQAAVAKCRDNVRDFAFGWLLCGKDYFKGDWNIRACL